MFVSTIFYSLSTIILGALVSSYLIAYLLNRSISILSILVFLVANFFIVLSISTRLWLAHYKLVDLNNNIPLIEFRSVALFFSSIFFLYTTWFNKTLKND
jgi:hypothetical protein